MAEDKVAKRPPLETAGGAYVGYRRAGRRPESQQDRQASANIPVAVARGLVSGTLGMPGDIESLARLPYELITGKESKTILPTSEDIEKRLPFRGASQTPVGQMFTGASQLAGGAYTGPLSGARAVMAVPKAVVRAGRDFVQSAGQTVSPLTVYHGSPHKFEKFDPSKIGTGEGAQAYGHGLYFAEAPEVAEGYAKTLANRDMANQGRLNAHANAQRLANLAGDAKYAADDIRFTLSNEPEHPQKKLLQETLASLESGDFAKPLQSKGNLYHIDLPDEKIAKMLDWDAKFEKQHPDVQKAILKYWEDNPGLKYYGDPSKMTGEGIYGSMRAAVLGPEGGAKVNLNPSNEAASMDLRHYGIPGVKYFDEGSRGAGEGTRNFVVFPGEEDALTILERKKEGGAVNMAEGGAAFGRYTTGKKYQGAVKRTKEADVNALPDPRTYAFVSGLLGEAPDQLGFSAMHPDIEGIKKAGERGFIGGTIAGVAPVVAPLTRGLPVGAAIKPVKGYRPNAPLSFDPKEAGRLAFESQTPERLALEAEAAQKMASMPPRSKAAVTEMGLYHPVGGGLKLSKPTWAMHSTTVPDPQFNPPPISIITPEQLVKEEAALFPLVGDRAAAGRYLTHVGSNELERPVRLTGGPRYMDANYNPINPEESAAWESGSSRVTALGRQAERAGEGGRPVYGIYTAGSGTNTDFNIMGANALLQQIPHSKITKKAEREFDRAMKEGTNEFPPVPNWPGIRSPKAEEMILDKSNGIVRTKLLGMMGKENFQSMGFPDVPTTRKAIIEPELLDVPTNQAGYRLAKMDPTGRTIESPNIPSDYPVAMAGQVAGKLDVPADYKDIFQSHFEARRLLGQPESGDYYSFSRAHPIQYANEEWLNRLMEQRFANEKKIREGGYKKGGDVQVSDNPDAMMMDVMDKKMAAGGAAYNTDPDMSDGGQIIQGQAFAGGGAVSSGLIKVQKKRKAKA